MAVPALFSYLQIVGGKNVTWLLLDYKRNISYERLPYGSRVIKPMWLKGLSHLLKLPIC